MQKNYLLILSVLIAGAGLLAACESLGPQLPEDDEVLDGPVEGLTSDQKIRFLKGDVAFNDDIFTAQSGLGPLFVATSCGSCHAGDGKGHPFTTLTRFGQHDTSGNQYLHLGGPQLQNRAIPGYQPEQIPPGTTFSKFTPPANTGLGFLEAVTDADILVLADPFDTNGDGISGVPNWVTVPEYMTTEPGAISQQGKFIGRFGKKAAAHNLLHQTVNAYAEDIGINSVYRSVDVYSGLEVDPEVSTQTINDVVFYLQTLKAPIQRNQGDAIVIRGSEVFNSLNCSGCHIPSLQSGTSPIEPLSNKTFYPYTDLLLHDMGSSLDDGYTEGMATTAEWRTPPLWGLGLSPDSQGGQYFLMHDGRAQSIEAAILIHDGEAAASRNTYQSLSESDKEALKKFLESL